jgi:hypothetical protein
MSSVASEETTSDPAILRSQAIPALMALTIALYLWRLVGAFSRFPGTLGDARFNQVVLEHLWRWATGRADSLSDPAFFYPYPNILYLSDCHYGSGWIYVIFRALGAPREVAFDLWFLVGVATTFAAAVFAFRRLGLPQTSALLGACLFALSLPMLAQDAHAQLIYRFPVPLATLACVQFFRAANLRSLCALALWVAWQFLCSVYLGVFLVEWLALMTAVAILRPDLFPNPESPSQPPGGRASGAALAVAAPIAIVLAGVMLARHAEVARAYGIQRDMREIEQAAPHWTSLLSMAGSPTVGWLSPLLPQNTVFWRWEHQLFPGLGVLLLAAAGAGMGATNPAGRRVVVTCLVGIVGLLALSMDVGGVGLYRWLAELPGLNAIRSPGRVAIVMAFPIAWLAALGMSALRGSDSRSAHVLMTIGLGLALLDIAGFRSDSRDIASSRARVAAISQHLDASALRARRAVLLRIGDSSFEQEAIFDIDLMIAAQDMGVASFNGYSGSEPPLWRRPRDCAEARGWIERVDQLPFKRAGADELAQRAVVLPPGACANEPAPPAK